MTRLFINLYLDEDVSTLVATLLKSRQHMAVTTQEEGNSTNSDEQQRAFATEHGMAILTHNRNDFLKLDADYKTSNRRHCGIIIAVRRSPYLITAKLMKHLDDVSAGEMDDQVYFI